MYMDKTLFQRMVFVLISTIIALSIVIIGYERGSFELPVHQEVLEEVEPVVEKTEPVQQPVVYIVYVYVDSKPVVEEKVEAAVKAEAPEVKNTAYYDVPLSEELQEHIIEQCENRGVDPALVMGMIRAESSFNADALGDGGNSHGLMQVQPRWHQNRMDEYGCDDLMDPFQNVTVGIDIIADWLDVGRGVEYALMGYNGGNPYAKEMWSSGQVSEYAQKVLKYAEGYGYGG